MAVSVDDLVKQTRSLVRDWPDEDVTTASLSSNGTTLTIGDGTIYAKNWHIEIDQEVITLAANGSGTTATIRRGSLGTTATTHVTASPILIRPKFFTFEIINALNAAQQDSFPLLYKPVIDTSLTTTSNTFEYTIPNMPGTYNGDTIPIQYISMVEMKQTGDTDYGQVREYRIRRGATPKIQFMWEPPSGATVRIHGFGPFPDFLTVIGVVDTLYRKNALNALVVGAASHLSMSGELGRLGIDTLAMDDREQANRVGSSLSVSNSLYGRYRAMLNNASMPRMPIHAVPTF